MKYQLRHLTEYYYDQPIANSYNLACLTPRPLPWQFIQENSLTVTPEPTRLDFYQDKFGNIRYFFHLQPPHQKLAVESNSVIEVISRNNNNRITQGVTLPELQAHLARNNDPITLEARLCSYPSKMIPVLAETKNLIKPFLSEYNVLQIARALTEYIFHEFKYDSEFSSVVTPIADVLVHKRGVCQDFAQLAISCLRAVGIPARYVSGYLETKPPEGQPRLVGADASHAWFAVFDPILGWVDFDPTNNILPDEQHITLSYGRDYADVVPLKGLLQGNGQHKLTVAVDVIPIENSNFQQSLL